MTTLGTVSIYAPGSPEISGQKAKCDKFAFVDGTAKLMSITTSAQQAKAYRAVMCGGAGNADTRIVCCYDPPGEDEVCEWSESHFLRDDAGYTCHVHRLTFGCLAEPKVHVAFISKDPSFMRVLSQEEVYQRLFPPKQLFDIPLLDDWLPWIYQALQDRKLLIPCDGFGSTSAVLRCDNAQLAEVVISGVKSKSLTFPDDKPHLQLVG